MTVFVKKPERISAIQFSGGFDSAVEVANWASEFGAHSAYPLPAIPSDQLVVSVGGGNEIYLCRGEWLVFNEGVLVRMKNEELERGWERE